MLDLPDEGAGIGRAPAQQIPVAEGADHAARLPAVTEAFGRAEKGSGIVEAEGQAVFLLHAVLPCEPVVAGFVQGRHAKGRIPGLAIVGDGVADGIGPAESTGV